MVVLARPINLLRVVRHVLDTLARDGAFSCVGRLVLVRLNVIRGRLCQEVAVELSPTAAHHVAAQPFVELGAVLEGKELEDEALMLNREVASSTRLVGRCGRRCSHVVLW